jgi:hypothetical protein
VIHPTSDGHAIVYRSQTGLHCYVIHRGQTRACGMKIIEQFFDGMLTSDDMKKLSGALAQVKEMQKPRPRRTYLEAATALVMHVLGVKDEECGEGDSK